MLDPAVSGRGWGHGWGLQAVVKAAMLLQWQVLSRWAARLEPPTFLQGKMRSHCWKPSPSILLVLLKCLSQRGPTTNKSLSAHLQMHFSALFSLHNNKLTAQVLGMTVSPPSRAPLGDPRPLFSALKHCYNPAVSCTWSPGRGEGVQ